MFRSIYRKIRKAWPVNRVVAALTPILFVPASGWIATKAADLGFNLTSDQFLAVFVVGAGAAVTAAYKWLDGWQQFKRAQYETDRALPLDEGTGDR